jgi:hypothetical protein
MLENKLPNGIINGKALLLRGLTVIYPPVKLLTNGFICLYEFVFGALLKIVGICSKPKSIVEKGVPLKIVLNGEFISPLDNNILLYLLNLLK